MSSATNGSQRRVIQAASREQYKREGEARVSRTGEPGGKAHRRVGGCALTRCRSRRVRAAAAADKGVPALESSCGGVWKGVLSWRYAVAQRLDHGRWERSHHEGGDAAGTCTLGARWLGCM